MPLGYEAVECVGLANELEGAAVKAGHDWICCTTGGSGRCKLALRVHASIQATRLSYWTLVAKCAVLFRALSSEGLAKMSGEFPNSFSVSCKKCSNKGM